MNILYYMAKIHSVVYLLYKNAYVKRDEFKEIKIPLVSSDVVSKSAWIFLPAVNFFATRHAIELSRKGTGLKLHNFS